MLLVCRLGKAPGCLTGSKSEHGPGARGAGAMRHGEDGGDLRPAFGSRMLSLVNSRMAP